MRQKKPEAGKKPDDKGQLPDQTLDKVSGGATATATELEQAATQTVVPRPINFKR
jgi:hypothetical protein